ncbi:unnamed protein product [Euphydryas editha]|uniref:Uncharacterized protein n=1 Tax=Euphydryas editha TaxID=104508 RepID=A0AAU9V9D4_EUPED|nr:unnamed protein product [Euphydryas editha]
MRAEYWYMSAKIEASERSYKELFKAFPSRVCGARASPVLSDKSAVLILARGGSKSVRLKNIRNIGGRSLLGRTIITAKLAGFQDITVSTDHPLIALEGLRYAEVGERGSDIGDGGVGCRDGCGDDCSNRCSESSGDGFDAGYGDKSGGLDNDGSMGDDAGSSF